MRVTKKNESDVIDQNLYTTSIVPVLIEHLGLSFSFPFYEVAFLANATYKLEILMGTPMNILQQTTFLVYTRATPLY